MKEKVLEAVRRFSLIPYGERVTVALSGGADSVALLHMLVSLRDELEITVAAAHFNHMIRGVEADRDEAFSRELCKTLGVPFTAGRGDVPKYSAEKKIGLEEAARELRYSFLESCDGLIATAHTASDNLETVLFNLTRGTGLSGLCGIPPKRGRFIRPLLLCSRGDIERYCAENGLSYVTDSTNLSEEYTRNKIRRKIVPLLKEINPSVTEAVTRTVAALSEEADFLNVHTSEYLSENITDAGLKISNLPHPAVAKAAFAAYALKSAGIRLESTHIDALYRLSLGGGRTSLPENHTAFVQNGLLKIEKIDTEPEKCIYRVSTRRQINDLFTNGKKVNNLLLKNSLDCDKIIGKSVLRTRLPGDSIRLAGRGCTKTLKKLYNEMKLSPAVRDTLPVMADERGVVWICGIGVAERCSVTKKTKQITVITAEAVQNITD